MALYGSAAEYAIHCLLLFDGEDDGGPRTVRSLAEFQGVSRTYAAKLFTALQKADIVTSAEGVKGGYRLARPLDRISVLDVVDAVEGRKPFFICRDVRTSCALFEGTAPEWARSGTCAVHAVMLDAEAAARETLSRRSLGDLARSVRRTVPSDFGARVVEWFGDR